MHTIAENCCSLDAALFTFAETVYALDGIWARADQSQPESGGGSTLETTY